MKVVQKSLNRNVANRTSVTLPAHTYQKIEALRGDRARSALLEELVEAAWERRERAKFVEELRGQYSEKVRAETLRLNDAFPVHES